MRTGLLLDVMSLLDQILSLFAIPGAWLHQRLLRNCDDFFSSQSIIDEIWAAIYFSKLCIADCTGRNPNVFYEIGMAHTIGRTAVLIAQSIEDIPFDILHRRSIIYEYTPRGMGGFEERLRKTLQNEIQSG